MAQYPVVRKGRGTVRPFVAYDIKYDGQLVGITRRCDDGTWVGQVESSRVLSGIYRVQGLLSEPMCRHADVTDWLVEVHLHPSDHEPDYVPVVSGAYQVAHQRQSEPQVACSACHELMMVGWEFNFVNQKDEKSPCCQAKLEAVRV